MQRCTRCLERKQPKEFIEESTRCEECRSVVKEKKRKKPRFKTSDHDDMEFIVGLLVGEFKGFNF
jgi:hypothetical protein